MAVPRQPPPESSWSHLSRLLRRHRNNRGYVSGYSERNKQSDLPSPASDIEVYELTVRVCEVGDPLGMVFAQLTPVTLPQDTKCSIHIRMAIDNPATIQFVARNANHTSTCVKPSCLLVCRNNSSRPCHPLQIPGRLVGCPHVVTRVTR